MLGKKNNCVINLLREYPCDHYTAVINVTLMNTGCPRSSVRDTALQLLQVLDKRFFGSGCVELLPPTLPPESPVTAREYPLFNLHSILLISEEKS